MSTDSRRAEPPDLSPTSLPAPIVNLQTAPAAPDPFGLAAAIQMLGRPDSFRDVTGLEGNQRNALAAFQGALSAAQNVANRAADLEQQRRMLTGGINDSLRTIEKAHEKGMITDAQREQLTNRALETMLGGDGHGREAVIDKAPIKEVLERPNVKELRYQFAGTGEEVMAAFHSPVELISDAGSAAAGDGASDDIIEPDFDADIQRGADITDGTERFIVLVAGYNYIGGYDAYGPLCINRARVLAATPAFSHDDSLVFLLFNVADGKVYMNRRQNGTWSLDKKDWRALDEIIFDTSTPGAVDFAFEPITRSKHYTGTSFKQEVANTVIGMPDVYAFLSKLGEHQPGSLLELSVLSHGYWNGPILVNSFDRDEAAAARDVTDKDARGRKDFRPENMSADTSAKIRAAFHADGFSWMWGCQVSRAARAVILGLADSGTRKTAWGRKVRGVDGATYSADGTTPDGAVFRFNLGRSMIDEFSAELDSGFFPAGSSSFDKTFAEITAFAKTYTDDSYFGRVAVAFDKPCFGPPIGSSSNYAAFDPYRPKGTPVVHWVERGALRPESEWADPSTPEREADYGPLIEFFVKSVGMAEDNEGRGYIEHLP